MPDFVARLPNRFDLPRRIARLGELAYNLWWTWNPDAQRLFSRIDNATWEALNHNPLRFLGALGRFELNAAAQDNFYLELYDQVFADFDAYIERQDTWFSREYPELRDQKIAYFSMEFGLHETLPIYSGGLGILAGDHLKESSDLGLPLVGLGILYTEGYFAQHISEDGWQEALNNPLEVEYLPALPVLDREGHPLTVSVNIADRLVSARLWELRIGRIPLYMLDANCEANSPADKKLTARLYWSDLELRILQEMLLGIGGARALHLLGYNPSVWHMNEGHAALLTLERARELVAAGQTFEQAVAQTRLSNVFTTHTPVPAGNDEFPLALVDKHLSTLWPELGLSRQQFLDLALHQEPSGETFSMPILALRLSEKHNAVSELHGRVARRMWHFLWPDQAEDDVPIAYVTNGVHLATWMAPDLRLLLDRHLGQGWPDSIDDPELWERVAGIPDEEIWSVRQQLKRRLVIHVVERLRTRWMRGELHPVQVIASGALLDPSILTVGFARRFATYKRADLLLSDIERLLEIVNRSNRPVQFIFAGKAHPADEPGKALLQQVYRVVKKAENSGRMVFLEDYDINLARYLVQGVDVWMNTPRRPNEACGTSGMKAALNGALNFSVLDGWWREAYNGSNGWAIGTDVDPVAETQDRSDAESLYNVLEDEIVPLYYGDRGADDIPHPWVARMKESIRSIAPHFCTRRMLKEYMGQLYFPPKR